VNGEGVKLFFCGRVKGDEAYKTLLMLLQPALLGSLFGQHQTAQDVIQAKPRNDTGQQLGLTFGFPLLLPH
jgi:hypothetical protein